MGNFEKLVVLTVLFLSAIVLAISLNDGKKKGERTSPLSAAQAQQQLDKTSSKSVQAAERKKQNNGLLLNTEVNPGAGPKGPKKDTLQGVSGRSSDGRPSILRSEAGLSGAGIDDYKVYSAAQGDTWAGLSERFYGSGRYVSLLRHANEDMMRPLEGEAILIPVYDFAEEAGTRAPLTPEVRVAQTDSTVGEWSRPVRREAVESTMTAAPVALVDATTAKQYEVRPGDNLSGIAQKVYGSGSRWNVIFEANRAVLKSPDWLQVGMQLVIPRGDQLQTLTAAVKDVQTAEKADTKKNGRVR